MRENLEKAIVGTGGPLTASTNDLADPADPAAGSQEQGGCCPSMGQVVLPLATMQWNRKGSPGLGTCVMEDTLFCMERHGKVTGIDDLDGVGSDVTKDNVAEI